MIGDLWTATVTLADGATHTVSGADRDRVINEAVAMWAPDEWADHMRRVLLPWSETLPARRVDAGGVTIVVTRDQ